jgi:octaprenyl-diphosphate synthase
MKNIQQYLRAEMKQFEAFFTQHLHTKVSLLNWVLRYVLHAKGKQMRPMFVLLGAKTHRENLSESVYIAATLVEYIHTATLVHDDVVDQADLRRGIFSVRAIWQNKIAVLVGDFLLSKALILAVEKKEFDLLQYVAQAVKEMSEGELLQLEKSRTSTLSEADYLEIIRKKTAVLIATCLAMGACSAGADASVCQDYYYIGQEVGMAFQIQDDILDYQGGAGKAQGNDVQERKITLPFLCAVQDLPSSQQKTWLQRLKKKGKSNKEVKEILDFVLTEGTMRAAHLRDAYLQRATQACAKIPESPSKAMLLQLMDFVALRKN